MTLQPIKPGVPTNIPWHIRPDGKYWRFWIPEESLRLDLFICSPDTWGLNFLIRTGSGVDAHGNPQHGFGPGMLRRWKELNEGRGMAREARLYDKWGYVQATPEEIDVFEACGVPWIEPRDRTDERAIERALEDVR